MPEALYSRWRPTYPPETISWTLRFRNRKQPLRKSSNLPLRPPMFPLFGNPTYPSHRSLTTRFRGNNPCSSTQQELLSWATPSPFGQHPPWRARRPTAAPLCNSTERSPVPSGRDHRGGDGAAVLHHRHPSSRGKNVRLHSCGKPRPRPPHPAPLAQAPREFTTGDQITMTRVELSRLRGSDGYCTSQGKQKRNAFGLSPLLPHPRHSKAS